MDVAEIKKTVQEGLKDFKDEVTKEVLKIPERYTRVCITPLGKPTEWPDSPSKKDLGEFIAYEMLP